MRKNTLIASVVATGIVMAGAAPSFAATASNSQNGTQSSNPNATDGAPTSTSAMPATDMPMGAQQKQDGAMTTGGTMTNGAGMATAPKQ